MPNEPVAYLMEPRDIQRLRDIANRLGDGATITPDQRRDMMNMIALIASNAQPFKGES